MDENLAKSKRENLLRDIKGLGSLLVAFSGGVDSTFLLAAAHEVLKDRVVAATATSETYPFSEQEEAALFAKERGIEHILFPSDETCLPEFVANNPDRCYHCKKSLSQSLAKMAKERHIKHIAHAANMDDLDDYRPGLAAAEEMGMLAPLVDAQLTKEEIRFLSKEMGLSTWDKAAMACLASRIPYGDSITIEKLRMVEKAEAFLAQQGFKQFRVRHHGPVARIEVVTGDIDKLLKEDLRVKILETFRELGFVHIAVDLEGYVSGNMNRVLENENWVKCD